MKKILFILLILNCPLLITIAQVQQKWVARYNGPANGIDVAKSIAVDNSGNVYVTGDSPGSTSGSDFATIKYNSNGVQQWVQRYNGPGNSYDWVATITVDGSGNSYITGASWGSGSSFDGATIKYNSAGVQQWIHRYNGINNRNDIPTSIIIDGSGNLYITGSTNYIYDDVLTLKYNSAGVLQWSQTYNNDEIFGDDYGYAIAVDGSGNVYVTGYSQGDGWGFDYVNIKYNSSGVEQWVRRYAGSGGGDDLPLAIVVDNSGNSYTTGFASTLGGAFDYATLKYNATGVLQWANLYDSPQHGGEYARSIVLDPSGNIIVTGDSYATNGTQDYATVKYNSSGAQLWVSRYNGPANNYDGASTVVTDAAGNVYVTGESTGNGTQRDYATLKYNSSGAQQWIQRYNGPGNNYDNARDIAVDAAGNVYITGESTGSGSLRDYATVKYSQGLRPVVNELSLENKLLENFPNPFNPVTVISYQLAVSSFASLKIYDVLGNEVATLVNDRKEAGRYSVEWNARDLSSGIYFYKLITDGFVETKKMNLIK